MFTCSFAGRCEQTGSVVACTWVVQSTGFHLLAQYFYVYVLRCMTTECCRTSVVRRMVKGKEIKADIKK